MARKWAVCIGINHYANMPDLEYAKRDAEKMRDWFGASGFEPLHLFADDADSNYIPTGNILKRFFRVVFPPDSLKIDDSVWFFFSGHGLRHEGKDYLMPSDGDPDPDGIEDTAISLSYVTDRLRNSGVGDVVIIYDACRDKVKTKGQGFGAEKQRGVITLASCSPDEKSYEIDDPAIQQGSFTYALLEALENTQLGRENYATFDRLYQRLRYRVPELNQRYNQPTKQHPSGYVDPDEKRYCILLPQRATIQDIEIYKKQALNAEINNNLQEAERLLIRLWEICPGDPEVRQYYNRVILKQGQQQASTTIRKSKTTIEPSPKTSVKPKQEQKQQVFKFDVITVNNKGQEINREKGIGHYFTEDLGDNVTLEMVAIPGDKFIMGSPSGEGDNYEKPQHEVTVQPFFMGKYPITQAQWRAVADLPRVKYDLDPDPSEFKGDNRPVEQVSWYDAVEFCQQLSRKTGREYRLPSEAEWEYACRAGTTTPFHFGETITSKLANYRASETYAREPQGEYRKETTPVGSFPPNGFGLYDMHGNVWEWCADNWHDNYKGAPTDGSAWTTGGDDSDSVRRGGSWYHNPLLCRSAYRYYNIRGRDIFVNVGFRVVCVAGRTR